MSADTIPFPLEFVVMLARSPSGSSPLLRTFSIAALFVIALASNLSAQNPSSAELAAQFGRWGADTLAAIDRDLWIADRNLYAEKVRLGERPSQPAFMWGAGVQLSAMVAAAKFEPDRYTAPLTAYADKLQSHWIERHGIGGYDVLPGSREPDRYYDDNAWIVLALLEIHNVTGDQKYLDRAASTMRFVLSGADNSLGGGLFWRENDRSSKNTCANAPAIVAALQLYSATSEGRYLSNAEQIYEWTRSHLQDTDDGLYWDSIWRSGRVNRRKYSYNSALMIRANCLLFQAKGDRQFLNEAEWIAQSAAARWIVPETGAVNDAGRFAHMLLESLLLVDQTAGNTHWQKTICDTLMFVRQNVRDTNGHYPVRWHASTETALKTFQLIDQASAARAYFATANSIRQRNQPTTQAIETMNAARPNCK